jgi:aminopeptidase N
MTRAALAFPLALVATASACGGGGDGDDDPPLPTGPITATVTHYDYRFDLDSRLATSTITATVDVAGDCLSLPYRAGELQQADTTLDDVPVRSASVTDDVLTVCGAGYASGHTLSFRAVMDIPLETLSASDVGFSTFSDAWGNDYTYLVSWVEGCDRFGPCDNRPDRFATYTFTVTHAAGTTVRCPGAITEPDTTTTRCDFTFAGGPSYSTFGVIAGTNFTVTNHDFSGIAVEVYDHPQSGIDARLDDAYHGGFLDFMRSHFGAFPYGTELRILTAPTYWAGFEHPGNIVLSDGLGPLPPPTSINYLDPLAHILNHEMAHQWAGDQTTIATTYDFVWKEAMVEYLSYVYEEDTDPLAALKTRQVWKAGANGAQYFLVPEDNPLPELFDYYGDVYGPGPLILFKQIEMLSSRAQVLTALESVLGAERALSVAEVEDALEASTGLELTDYFAVWAHGAGAPVWPRVSATYAAGELTVSQTNQAAGIRPCLFDVELRGANPDERQRVTVDMFTDGPDQVIPVTPAPAFAVTSTVIDPDAVCLVFPSTATAAPAERPRPYLGPH